MKKVFLISLLITTCLNILLSMDGKRKRCISKDIDIGDTLFLSYVVTGDDDTEKTNIMLVDPDNTGMYYKDHVDSGEFKKDITKQGRYKLCFRPSSGKSHYISLEFYTMQERGHTLNLAKDGI
jgi:hypothetical protein